jgi:hypothetical protein
MMLLSYHLISPSTIENIDFFPFDLHPWPSRPDRVESVTRLLKENWIEGMALPGDQVFGTGKTYGIPPLGGHSFAMVAGWA